jgi:Cu+-exporting ATPase
MSDDKITLPVAGMTCANCAMNIERSVKKLNGVSDAQVNFAAEQASISFDPTQLQVKDVVAKIDGSGYSVPTNKVEFPVTGMTCANCAANIERALNKKVSGIVNATVNFASERAAVEYIPGAATLQDMIAAIEGAGYGVIAPEEISEEEDAEQIARQAEIREQTRSVLVLRCPFLSGAWPEILVSSARGAMRPGSTGFSGCWPPRSSFIRAGIIM